MLPHAVPDPVAERDEHELRALSSSGFMAGMKSLLAVTSTITCACFLNVRLCDVETVRMSTPVSISTLGAALFST
jgi:hypothetical protein